MIIARTLEDFAWMHLETPTLGALEVPAGSGDFLDWVRTGFKASRWPDGPSLVRDLLATHVRPTRAGEPLGADAANALSPAVLDEFTDALIAATATYFRPQTVAEGHGPLRRVRRRRDDEADELAVRAGEGGAERLKRILETWIKDRADFNTMIVQQVGLPTAQLKECLAAATSVSRMFEDHRRFMRTIDPLPGLSAMRAAQPLGYSKILEGLRPPPGMAAITAAMSPSSGILARIQTQRVHMAEIARLGAVPNMDALSGIKLYPNLAFDLAIKSGALSELSRAAKAMADSLAISKAAELVGLSVLSDQAAMASALRQQFGLRLPTAALAFVSTLGASTLIANHLRAPSLFPPGFQMTAALGLENRVARSLVAEVLHHYEPAEGDAQVFADVLESTAIVDDGALTEAQAVSFLKRASAWLIEAIKAEKDIIRRAGLVSAMMFMLAIVNVYTGTDSDVLSHHSADIAEQSLAIAQAGPTHTDITALIRETHAVGEAVKADQQGDAAATNHIRYVHQKAPLRAEPQPQALVLRVIYPDQLLRLVDERGDWVEVEAFDYRSDAPMRGWISRRRLRLTPQP